VHAQNETMMAFDPPARLVLLDSAAGLDVESVAAAHSEWKKIKDKIAELESGEQDKLRLMDLWNFQLKEIDAAAPLAGEDEKLLGEKRVLANSEKIHVAAMAAFDSLYEGESSASSTIRIALKHLEELGKFDDRFKEQAAALESARITVEDIGTTLRDYAEGIEASPEKLADVEDRLALLDRLKRKYGHTLDEVIAFGEDLRQKLNEIENKDELLKELRANLKKAAEQYLTTARTASKKRYETARKLEKTVEAEINDLAMKAKFAIEVSGSDEEQGWSPSGFDHVAYMIATNPGQPMLPIEKIASGGELSRVMLALKATVEGGRKKSADHQRTLVFDEVDAGIGGRAADAVGKKLKSLSRTKQVLCITHLPQIASFADQHFVIEKRESGGKAKTSVRRLDHEERREEVARMLSGAKVTDASLKNAEQLLKANA
jgi:DNA repair protein RecN (Recombination protein N)